jgi:hypothetical protein
LETRLIEEGFVQMYTRDFAALAAKAESGLEVEAALVKRINETRAHATLMDSRKGQGHLGAVAERLRLESRRKDALHQMRPGADPAAALARREAFLVRVADMLDAAPELVGAPGMAVRP